MTLYDSFSPIYIYILHMHSHLGMESFPKRTITKHVGEELLKSSNMFRLSYRAHAHIGGVVCLCFLVFGAMLENLYIKAKANKYLNID